MEEKEVRFLSSLRVYLFSRLALLTLALCIWVPRAAADILLTTGAMVEISAPVSLLEGGSETSALMQILDEGLTLLPAALPVNAVGPGTFTGSSGPVAFIPSGTVVHTYIVHFDPAGGVVALMGGVTFDPGEFILGIQTHTPLLDFSDPIVGHPMAMYPTGTEPFRAFETLPGTDTVMVPPSMASASFSLFAELGVDQARIVTAPVPEPASATALLLAALAGVTVRRR